MDRRGRPSGRPPRPGVNQALDQTGVEQRLFDDRRSLFINYLTPAPKFSHVLYRVAVVSVQSVFQIQM